MSRKQREERAIKTEQEIIEKKAVEMRRRERVEPMFKTAKKINIVVTATVFILYLGVTVNDRLPEILIKIAENG